jgi:hypothetical protein
VNTQNCILYCSQNSKSDGIVWSSIYKLVSVVTVYYVCVCDQNDVRINCNKIRGNKFMYWFSNSHHQVLLHVAVNLLSLCLFPLHLWLTSVNTRYSIIYTFLFNKHTWYDTITELLVYHDKNVCTCQLFFTFKQTHLEAIYIISAMFICNYHLSPSIILRPVMLRLLMLIIK